MSTWIGAVSTDWNNPLNWGAGGTGAGIPSATVDAIFSGTPVNACVLGAPRACRALTFVGYTSTVDLATFTLTTNNNITFQADQSSRILGSTGILISGAAATITSNTGTWPLNFQIANFGVTPVVLADDMRVSGSYLSSGGSRVVNGFSLFVGTNLTSSSAHSGTTNFIMNGSGTYTGTSTCNLEINTSGTVVVTGTVIFTRRFIVAVTGTVTMTAANVTISNTTTIDVNGKTVGNLTHGFSAPGTITYLSDIYCSNFSLGNGSNIYNGPGQIYASGNYVLGTASGSLIVNLIGTGTISTGTMGLSCAIAATGNYTLGATLTIGNTFTTAVGATLTTTSSTVTIGASITISTPSINWNNITILANVILTISQTLLVTNNLTLNGTTTFTGVSGWTTGNFTHAGAAFTCTLKAGNTYTVNGLFTMIGTAGSRAILQSSDAVAVTASIASLSNQLVVTAGTLTAPAAGYVLGSTSTALPIALNNLLPDRPTIASGAASPYTLVNAIGVTALASGSYTLGKKAFLIVTNGTGSTNVAYVTTRDIDSNGGITILAFASYSDAIGQPTANLFRTLNWGPLIAPSGSVYYTFVN
jgi:hypothetical protein